MIEPRVEIRTASDGYALHGLVWPAATDPPLGAVVVLHGVQSHGGWYHNLGRSLAEAGYQTHFPDRRGSGANPTDRGDTPSASRLIDDVAEQLRDLRASAPGLPLTVAGISWGGKLAVITAADHPELVDALALICPGLHPRVDVSTAERLRIALAFVLNRRKRFPIPLGDPALFTDNPDAQRFIASDPLSLRTATAALLAASSFIDRRVRRARTRVRQRTLLMLAGNDRIVDNERTLAYVRGMATAETTVVEYPDGHHTLEFDPDPSRYARDLIGWLGRSTLTASAARSDGSSRSETP